MFVYEKLVCSLFKVACVCLKVTVAVAGEVVCGTGEETRTGNKETDRERLHRAIYVDLICGTLNLMYSVVSHCSVHWCTILMFVCTG